MSMVRVLVKILSKIREYGRQVGGGGSARCNRVAGDQGNAEGY